MIMHEHPAPPDDEPTDAGPARGLECPRCGHDLRGVVASWREACPLTGICTECGLELEWADVLSARLSLPRWSVEGCRGLHSWIKRLGPQLFMATVRPRLLLRRIRMEHAFRPLPLVASFAGLVVLPVLLTWGVVLVGFLDGGVPVRHAVHQSLRVWDRSPRTVLLPVRSIGPGRIAVSNRGRFVIVDDRVLTQRALPVPVLAADDPMPSTPMDLGPEQLLMVHPTTGGRVLLVGSPRWGPMGGPVARAFETDPATLGLTTMPPMSPGPPGPFRPGWYDPVRGDLRAVPGEARFTVSPMGLAIARNLSFVPLTLRPFAEVLRARAGGAPTLLGAFGGPLVLAAVSAAAGFAVLPIARSRARVRWVHLVRLAAYAGLHAIGVTILLVAGAAFAGWLEYVETLPQRLGFPGLAVWLRLHPDHADGLFWLTVSGLLPVAIAGTWWSWAAGHHLRMSRPWAVGLSVSIVAPLTIVTGVALLGAALR
jgi:hypothetical protein